MGRGNYAVPVEAGLDCMKRQAGFTSDRIDGRPFDEVPLPQVLLTSLKPRRSMAGSQRASSCYGRLARARPAAAGSSRPIWRAIQSLFRPHSRLMAAMLCPAASLS